MTPQELYERYKGKKAKESVDDAANPEMLSEGIVVGYVLDETDYTLIIAVTNEGDGRPWEWVTDDVDFIIDMKGHPGGYQYITAKEVQLIKFGH